MHQRAIAALVLLGAASGLPNPMVDALFTTWLVKAGWSTADVVLAGLVTVPYALKPLWAPIIDRCVPPFLGRRRGWLALAQLATAGGLAAMAWIDPQGARGLLLTVAALTCVASATIDLATNGYACEAVPPSHLPAAAGAQVWGYKAAFLAVMAGVPWLAAGPGWGVAYLAAAAAMVVGLCGVALAPEPPAVAAPASLRAAVVEPLRALRDDLGWRALGLLVAFVLLYRFTDSVAGLFIAPFLAKHYATADLAWRGLAGLVGAGLGVALAGWTGTRWSVTTGLWVYGLAQAVSNLVYVAIDLGGLPGIGGFIVAGVIDNACAAAAATVFVGFLMARCRPGLAATQYALLITITLLPPHALRFFGGLPDRIGWSATFVATALLVVPGLLLIRRVVVQPRS